MNEAKMKYHDKTFLYFYFITKNITNLW